MYFRLPLFLLVVFLLIVGLYYVNEKLKTNIPSINGETLASSREDLSGVNFALKSIKATELKAHLEFLADDLLEGRGTGTRGARLSSLYIAKQFEKIGLQPVNKEGSYLQPVFLRQIKILPSSEFKIEIDGEMIPLKYKEDFLIAAVPKENEIELAKDLVFTGYGIQAPEYNYDDFKNVEVKGKIAVYMSGEPPSKNEKFFHGEEVTQYAREQFKRKIAISMKAEGVIGVLTPQDLKQVDWLVLQETLNGPRMTLIDRVGEEKENLPSVLIHPEAGKLIFANSPQSFEQIIKAAQEETLNSFYMNKKAQLKIVTEEKLIEDQNVIGFLEGSDSHLKSEVVVYTAHYDHLGIKTPVQGDSIYNGAADNASGVSGLIEVAEAFMHLPKPPKRSILFLAVTAEEKGLLGSEYYVNHPIFPISKTVANINIDIMGLGDSTGVVVYGLKRSSLGEVIKKAAQEIGLEVLPDQLPQQRIFFRSDQYSFAKKGVPAIFPGFGLDKRGFKEFMKYYHKPSDEVELPFNYHYMKKHAQILFLTGLWVANSEEPPKWTPGDDFEKVRIEATE